RASSASPRQLHGRRADEALQRWRELAHADADLFGGKLAQQRLRDLAGETLDEVHATLRPDLDDPARNLAVIDGTREVVGHGRAREVHRELDVDREPHANGLLGGGDAVMTVKAHVLQTQSIGGHSFPTGFLREPNALDTNLHITRSPARRASSRGPVLARRSSAPPAARRARTCRGCARGG